jgi:hypothetical protein
MVFADYDHATFDCFSRQRFAIDYDVTLNSFRQPPYAGRYFRHIDALRHSITLPGATLADIFAATPLSRLLRAPPRRRRMPGCAPRRFRHAATPLPR